MEMELSYGTIRVMIAEDEDRVRDHIRDLLLSFRNVEVIGSYPWGADLLEAFPDANPTAVFLDIMIGDMDGLKLAASLQKLNPNILLVFITGYTEYAATAYQLDAVDYLIKPVTRESIGRSLSRIEKRLRLLHSMSEDIICVQNRHELYFIHRDEIIYIEKQLRKSIIHTADRLYETSESLGSLESKLPYYFFRCHKSFVVNINKIEKIAPVADRTYAVLFHECKDQVYMGRKSFEILCGLIASRKKA
ncbi:MAG: LytTR family DNA-binding domain-containing protein [Syntrophomonas sp.]